MTGNDLKISCLWFSDKDGWQVTSFKPEDNGEATEFVDRKSYEKAQEKIKTLEERVEKLRAALGFYGDKHHIHDHGGSNYTDNGECCQYYSEPDTVSGEPANYFEGHGDYGFEDGSIARVALKEDEEQTK